MTLYVNLTQTSHLGRGDPTEVLPHLIGLWGIFLCDDGYERAQPTVGAAACEEEAREQQPPEVSTSCLQLPLVTGTVSQGVKQTLPSLFAFCHDAYHSNRDAK